MSNYDLNFAEAELSHKASGLGTLIRAQMAYLDPRKHTLHLHQYLKLFQKLEIPSLLKVQVEKIS